MFNKKSKRTVVNVKTTISGVEINGNLSSISGIYISETTVNGNIDVKYGNTYIMDNSFVVGNIVSNEDMFISGIIKGDVHCNSNITMYKGACVIGNIEAASFNIEVGARYSGNCKVISNDIDSNDSISLNDVAMENDDIE